MSGEDGADSGSVRTQLEPRVRMRDIAVVWILFFINLFNYIDRYIVAGVLELIIKKEDSGFSHDLSDSDAGLLTTIFIVSYMVLSPLFGFLGDRYNRPRLIAFGLVIWAGSTLACSYVASYWQLLMFRAFVGVGEASYSALAPTIIADLMPPKQRTFYLSFFFIGTPVGGALGYIIGGAAGKAGWRWAFRVSPPFCVLLALVTLVVVRDPDRGGSDNPEQLTVSQEIQSPENPVLQLLYESWSIIKIKTFLYGTIGFSCLCFVIGGITNWVPVFIQRASVVADNGVTYDNASANFIFGVFACVSGLVSIPAGSILSKFVERYTQKGDALINAYGMLIASITLFLGIYSAVHWIYCFWVFCFITQLSIFLGWAPNMALILYTCPPRMRSLASALNILVSHLLGDAISPTIQGKLSDSIKGAFSDFDISISDCYSLEYSFFLSCFICLLGSVFYFLAAENVIRDRLMARETLVSRRGTAISTHSINRGNSTVSAPINFKDEYDGPLTRPLISNTAEDSD